MTESRYTLYQGDCLEVMKGMAAESVDAVVSDPPYGLSFMGKDWDKGVPGEAFWVEALRVAKPGAHLLAFGGTRTFHRLACAIEDAGWELRDTIMYVYGSGFPKSHSVSKAIDREAGAEREVVRIATRQGNSERNGNGEQGATYGDAWGGFTTQSAPATAEAEQWSGWGTALKPAWEPIIVARKPIEGTVAQNVLAYGTGGLNIDGCRVGTDEHGASREHKGRVYDGVSEGYQRPNKSSYTHKTDWHMQPNGRWPANLIHDGSEEVLGLFPDVKTGSILPHEQKIDKTRVQFQKSKAITAFHTGDSGTAARFFYCAKASKEDRDEGMPEGERNNHPTIKPVSLMKYLCRLVTPPDGVILDPFMGSGSTGKGAILEGFRFVGIDITAEYVEIARARLEFAEVQYRNAAGEIVVTAKEKERGMVSLFDWAGEATP